MMELEGILDLYAKRREERLSKLEGFWAGQESFLVIQRPSYHLWGECNSVEAVVANNRRHLEAWLSMDWSDELPHMQAWFGTGVYANAFGCEYLWREGEAPDTHVRYHHIEEVRGLVKPDWRNSPVMRMVLDCLDRLRELSRGLIPIAVTDTQSPFDTATLVLDTSEFFANCYLEEETVAAFMDAIADLIVDFTREQARHIGEGLVARPGHVMPSLTTLGGVMLSDDNLAVSSPHINALLSLPCNERIARELGGVAIHSCGVWDQTMRLLPGRGVMAVDCSVSPRWDPTPMTPRMVRDALAGTGIVVKARCGGTRQEIEDAIAILGGGDMRLILDIARIDTDVDAYAKVAESNYRLAIELLAEASRQGGPLPGPHQAPVSG
jgi:hypothetical protein